MVVVMMIMIEEEEDVVVVVVFTREKSRGICSTGEEDEAVVTRESITKQDPPNAHQAQHRRW